MASAGTMVLFVVEDTRGNKGVLLPILEYGMLATPRLVLDFYHEGKRCLSCMDPNCGVDRRQQVLCQRFGGVRKD